ncbi:hypothetical protein S40293_04632 [Stachybotrys chartarum IBT 40293]|nr:hypothetical protein S40293_04632 [Stachybotrys chartarum IBT 40293]
MHNIVVLGVGIAGAPIIRQTMKNVVLPSNDYKLYVVVPTTHYHFPLAMPRVIVPGQIPDEKILFELAPHFKEYPAEKFEFVLGKAESLDPKGKVIEVSLNDGGSKSIAYNTLIVATGSSDPAGVPWKDIGTTEKTRAKIHAVQDEIKKAKTIVVVGGGATGVETAGELGFEYSRNGTKEVILVYKDALPLAPLYKDSVRQAAENELSKLKVRCIPNSTVTSVTRSGDDYVLELRSKDGSTSTLTAQAHIPATGLTPNTAFAPASLLDKSGRMKQTTFLQAEDYPDIFVVGDAGNLQQGTALNASNQALHLIKSLPVYFKGGQPLKYEPDDKVVAAFTIGRSRGTGQVGNIKLFSLLVWWLKGRYLGTDIAYQLPAGKRTSMAVIEK